MAWIRASKVRAAALRKQSFQLSEPLLDWVEVGAVGWQVEETGFGAFDRRSDALDLVTRQIIQDDDIAGLKLGNEELLDPGPELLAVHRPIEGARRDETVLPQRADEGRRLPMAPWNRRDKALAAQSIGRRAGSFWSMRRFRRQTPDFPLAIRPVAPTIAGALARCRRDPVLRRVATFFERQAEMTDPRP